MVCIISRLHLAFLKNSKKFLHSMYLFREICRADAYLLRHMAIAGAQCKQIKFHSIFRRFHASLCRCTSVEHFQSIQPMYRAKVLLQSPVIVAERMGREAYSALSLYQIDEFLRRDALPGIILNSKCHDISLPGEELNPHEDRKPVRSVYSAA